MGSGILREFYNIFKIKNYFFIKWVNEVCMLEIEEWNLLYYLMSCVVLCNLLIFLVGFVFCLREKIIFILRGCYEGKIDYIRNFFI